MSDAPERIWVEKAIAEEGNHGSTAWPNTDDATDIEYVRADLHAATLRREADANAAAFCHLSRIAALTAERDHWKRVADQEGVCMSCRGPNGSFDPCGCTDCLNTGYCGEHHNLMHVLTAERDALAAENERLRKALRRHHDWHLSQDRDGAAWGIDPVDAYSGSGLCEETVTALAAYRATEGQT